MKRALICCLLLLFPVLTLTSVNSYSLKVYSINEPDFTLINSTITDVQPGTGVVQFNATIQNNGSAPATTGTVPISWEKSIYEIALSGGMGTLNESEADLDLNGDDDKIDTFDVEWVHNETRPWDAMIANNYVYALTEGPPEDPWRNQTYYLNGKPKLFQLGNKTHMLYEANEDIATFGVDAFILNHPSPNFHLALAFYDVNVAQHLNASEFQINGESVEVNHTITWIVRVPYLGWPPFDFKIYIVPNQATKFDLGENITFSCLIKADETMFVDVGLYMNWSPDGNRRNTWDWYDLELFMSYPFVVNTSSTTTTSTTTTSTTSTTSTTTGTPGFSILTSLSLLLIIVVLLQRRR